MIVRDRICIILLCTSESMLLVAALVLFALRFYVILGKRAPFRRASNSSCKVAVFLGSGKHNIHIITDATRLILGFMKGGHTSEALTLMSALDFRRYTHRIYIVSEGDNLSAQKALALESQREQEGGGVLNVC
jgi:beta-1,4-N-acetylglucosaminyltransferase